MSTNTNGKVHVGLEGVVAAETRLSAPNGLAGELVIGGFSLEELAGNATFEETVFLLWNGRLPKQTELDELKQELAQLRPLPSATVNLLRSVAKEGASVMDALRIGVGTLSLEVEESKLAQAIVARCATIVATYWRLLSGLESVAPNPELNHAANYLYMLTGEIPTPALVRGMETYFNTVIDHGLNASTFTARVIVATGSDLVSAVTGAVGALKGPLHGGAPGPALDMVFEIGRAENAEPYLRQKLDRGERLMGFGHRVYKVRDPRAEVLSVAAEKMFADEGNLELYDLVKSVEETAVSLLAEYKPGRNLQTNVEFYTALLLHGLGLDSELFTPTFAVSRAAGWIAHCFEQQQYGRLIRPKSIYIGETEKQWVAVDLR